jgi:hypothetical protein
MANKSFAPFWGEMPAPKLFGHGSDDLHVTRSTTGQDGSTLFDQVKAGGQEVKNAGHLGQLILGHLNWPLNPTFRSTGP